MTLTVIGELKLKFITICFFLSQSEYCNHFLLFRDIEGLVTTVCPECGYL